MRSGNRTLHRDLAGVPGPNKIRAEGYFAVDEDESFLVALTRQTAGGGVGVLRFKPGGVGEVITLSGAADKTRNKGAGIDYDVAGYAAINVVGGKIYLLNGDANALMTVDSTTGDRVVLSGGGVGKDTDGNGHAIASPAAGQTLFIDTANNVAYANSTKIDLKTGDRSFISPLIRDVIEPQHPSNAFGNVGMLVHVDGKKFYDVLEDTTNGGYLRVFEPDSGNFNFLSRE